MFLRSAVSRPAATLLSSTARIPAASPSSRLAAQVRFNSGSNVPPSQVEPTRPCPSCGKPIPYPASPCPNCGGLVNIPPGSSSHSSLGVSDPIPVGEQHPTFNVGEESKRLPSNGMDSEPRDLRMRMLRRQQDSHPDRHHGDALAEDLSGRINKAYETLASPSKRIEYISEQYDMATDETDKVDNHDSLMEISEARETLEEADGQEVEESRQDNQAKVDDIVHQICESSHSKEPDSHAVKRLAVESRYWVQLENAAKAKLDKMGH